MEGSGNEEIKVSVRKRDKIVKKNVAQKEKQMKMLRNIVKKL